jgi:hypothetical protein
MVKVKHNGNEYSVIQTYVDGWLGWRYFGQSFIEFHRLIGNYHSSFYIAIGDLHDISEEAKENEEPLPF